MVCAVRVPLTKKSSADDAVSAYDAVPSKFPKNDPENSP
jgi:hypothetical protein